MKKIAGIWLPDGDEHFADHLARGDQVDGGGSYQLGKIVRAVDATPASRRRFAVDVGAHVGLWTRVLAKHFAGVFAFEPVQAFRECWHENVAHVGDRCYMTRAACGAAALSEVGIAVTRENSGNSHVTAGLEPGSASAPMVRLDDCFGQGTPAGDKIDLIKVDVEGYELEVLRGARALLERCRPVVVVEQKPGNAERYGKKQFDARDFLAKMGARLVWERAGDVCMRWD